MSSRGVVVLTLPVRWSVEPVIEAVRIRYPTLTMTELFEGEE